jgi:hypothetical protein
MYRIREVGSHDDDVADMLTDLHRLTFFRQRFDPGFRGRALWLAFRQGTPVAFAGVISSMRSKCRIFFSCRRAEEALRQRPAITFDASDRIACAQ